jgi:3-vinyl bacteriochlorophyllide hydratase
MSASFAARDKDGFDPDTHRDRASAKPPGRPNHHGEPGAKSTRLFEAIDNLFDDLAPSPWGAHAGHTLSHNVRRKIAAHKPLYTPEERLRRDQSPWTIVQGVLAPLQFLVFAISLGLVARYLITGQGYQIATLSILVKTVALYSIMITGSIWEKEVFGKWLFAHAFFWEDVFSMLVLGLQTTYVAALILGWGTPRQQMLISMAAYAAYAINAFQFLWKLRQARLEAPSNVSGDSERLGQPA